MHGSMSLPRTKCADTIPGGRSSGGRLPAVEGQRWHHARLAPAALTQESPGGTRRVRLQRQRCGSVPAPHLSPPARGPAPRSRQWALMKPIVSTVRGFRSYFAAEIRGRGKKNSAQWPFHSNKKGFQEVQSVSKLYPKATEINRGPLHFCQWTLEEAIT